MERFNRKFWKLGGLLILLLAMGVLISSNHNNSLIKNKSVAVEDAYVVNYADDQILVGASHNIFIGKVIGKIGNISDDGIPETQFMVDVISNIKGDLDGQVIVDQQGGYSSDGTFYYIEGGVPLLQTGITYLVATRYNPAKNWNVLNSYPTASKIISTDSTISNDQLKALIDADPRVKALKIAYPNEILLEADVAYHNTLNSYQSLFPITANKVSTTTIATTTLNSQPAIKVASSSAITTSTPISSPPIISSTSTATSSEIH